MGDAMLCVNGTIISDDRSSAKLTWAWLWALARGWICL